MPSKPLKIDCDKNIAGITVSTKYQNHYHDITVVKHERFSRSLAIKIRAAFIIR